MKIALRLSDPVTDKGHQSFILGTVFRDVAGVGAMYMNGSLYFPKNPFKFNDEGTLVAGELKDITINERSINTFKTEVVDAINGGLRGNTIEMYKPPSGFPRVQIKTVDVENEKEHGKQ